MMPTINKDQVIAAIRLDPSLSYDQVEEFVKILSIVVKKDNSIRASKPKVSQNDHSTGKAAYVWRMVVFMVSRQGAHQCMPMMADFDIFVPEAPRFGTVDKEVYYQEIHKRHEERRATCKVLDRLVDFIVDSVPKSQWHGVNRWGRALGYI